MTDHQQCLLDRIEAAFAGVELGDGVSLHETRVIDDYGSDEERRVARAPDEKSDWRRLIHDPELVVVFSEGYGGLTFLDAAGVRFHLPACLSRAVKDLDDPGAAEVLGGLLEMMGSLHDFHRERLALLDPVQRVCVRDVLQYVRELEYFIDDLVDDAIKQFQT